MADNPTRIMIISGEASGDLHGAELAAALMKKLPGSRISGIGGGRMRQAGVEVLWDSSSWSAIGISDAVPVFARLVSIMRKVRAYMKQQVPDILILIDFGFFNLRVVQGLPKGVKVLYYFPPGSWRKTATCPQLTGIVDSVVTPFAWSEVALRGQGYDVHYFGHPLLDIVHPQFTRNEFCDRFGFDKDRPIIGLLPGSRRQEIAHNVPVILNACARLLKTHPDLQFAIPLASSVNGSALKEELSELRWVEAIDETETQPNVVAGPSAGLRDSGRRGGRPLQMEKRTTPLIGSSGSMGIAARTTRLTAVEDTDVSDVRVKVKLLPGLAYDILAHSRAAIVTSGTATVEAAILGCPMVIMYQGSWLANIEWKLRGSKIKFVGMPNIVLDRQVAPELIMSDATPSAISEVMTKLIADSPERAEMLSGLQDVRSALGNPGAVEKTAEVVIGMLGPRSLASLKD